MILFLTASRFNYGQDLLYAGLATVLGKERVVEVPFRPELHQAGLPYPSSCGYAPGPGRKLPWRDAVRLCQEGAFELVVVGSSIEEPLAALHDLRQAVSELPPQVFVDQGDHTGIGQDAPEAYARVTAQRPFDLVFKRELPQAEPVPDGVHPFPLCANSAVILPLPAGDKRHPFFFGMRVTSQMRQDLGERIAALGIPYAGGGLAEWRGKKRGPLEKLARSVRKRLGRPVQGSYFENIAQVFQVSGREYLETLARCHVGLSAGGVGFDTLRYWEVPACGAMLLSERPTIWIPDDFEDGRQAVFFDTVDEFEEKLRHYLDRPEECQRIADAGHQHFLERHDAPARAGFLLDRVREDLGVDLVPAP